VTGDGVVGDTETALFVRLMEPHVNPSPVLGPRLVCLPGPSKGSSLALILCLIQFFVASSSLALFICTHCRFPAVPNARALA